MVIAAGLDGCAGGTGCEEEGCLGFVDGGVLCYEAGAYASGKVGGGGGAGGWLSSDV